MKAIYYGIIGCLVLTVYGWARSAPANRTRHDQADPVPYANMPDWAVPFGRFRKPYYEFYIQPSTLAYDGAAREAPEGILSQLKTINIGVLSPLDKDNPDSAYGIPMLHGAELAVEQANARGGYHGKPFALKVHDDLPLWGASAMAIVKMDYDQHVWAMLGSVNAASTHIELRATLKLEIPIIDTATNDPTVTETRVPWLLHNFPDDRQQGYALADYIFNQLKLRHVAVLRSTNRYGRLGDAVFLDVARRLSHQPVLEAKYNPGEQSFSTQLRMIQQQGSDAVVIWGNASQAGRILRQMRAMGMKQRVFASSRACSPQVIKIAGRAAEDLVTACAMNPDRKDPQWLRFQQAFSRQFHAEPDAYAAYAYDGMNILIGAIEEAGLNRGRIMDALRQYEMKGYHGVAGYAFFDYTLNNIAPITMGQVSNGQFIYWPERRTDWGGPVPPFMRAATLATGR
jgi:ABC-type branched-subunit amino acid transport system substrate-binding protein